MNSGFIKLLEQWTVLACVILLGLFVWSACRGGAGMSERPVRFRQRSSVTSLIIFVLFLILLLLAWSRLPPLFHP